MTGKNHKVLEERKMKIRHIYHSGFLVTLDQCALLFDWYTGPLPAMPPSTRLYVFCSHAHEDHYSPMIWKLRDRYRQVTYILDEGIPDGKKHPEARVISVRPRNLYEVDGLVIRTLESTDMGVAFYVEAEGKKIYHAGDLNVWYWNDEPMEDNLASEKKCRGEMQYLSDVTGNDPADPVLDAAFVPLDPRLEEHGPRCLAAFMEILGAKHVFPMHYWNMEEKTMSYLEDERLRPLADRVSFAPEADID